MIISEKQLEELNNSLFSKKICRVNNCNCNNTWDQHGIFCIKDNILYMKGKSQYFYDDLYGGWKIKYFKSEIYNEQGENINILINKILNYK